tara:strand:- start:2299 stop:2826 length:528 start_codon:yes stop_codon:yes gene_type:complete
MFYYLFLPFSFVATFINQGGYVLIVLFVVALYMWFLISERIFFYKFQFKPLIDKKYISFQKKKTDNRWLNGKLKKMFLDEINSMKLRNINQIKGLVALCPLLGLLGTVTGMIEVFDVMAFTGTGNPRAMASGVSKATLPTMTGLVISISGLFAITIVEKYLQSKSSKNIKVFEND